MALKTKRKTATKRHDIANISAKVNPKSLRPNQAMQKDTVKKNSNNNIPLLSSRCSLSRQYARSMLCLNSRSSRYSLCIFSSVNSVYLSGIAGDYQKKKNDIQPCECFTGGHKKLPPSCKGEQARTAGINFPAIPKSICCEIRPCMVQI